MISKVIGYFFKGSVYLTYMHDHCFPKMWISWLKLCNINVKALEFSYTRMVWYLEGSPSYVKCNVKCRLQLIIRDFLWFGVDIVSYISQTLTCYVVMFFLYVVMLGYSTACMTKMDGGSASTCWLLVFLKNPT